MVRSLFAIEFAYTCIRALTHKGSLFIICARSQCYTVQATIAFLGCHMHFKGRHRLLNDSRKQAFITIIAQLAVTVTIFILLVFVDWTAAYSALTGGLIAALTTAWFAAKVFGAKQINEPVVVLRSFYWGEINKILLTGALFVAAFVLIRPVNGAALLAVYFLVYMTPLVVDYFIQPKRRREN
jgi:ATP synthase protein I